MSTTAPESTAAGAGANPTVAGESASVRYDPIMVVAAAGSAAGPADDPTFAIWQVETDPDVQLGDFSGAWLIDGAGIHGFAANADWIEGTDDRAAMLAALLRYPVLFVGDAAAAELLPREVALIDVAATEAGLEDALASAKQHFSSEFPDKKQPAWGSFRPLAEFREAEAGIAGAGASAGDGADDAAADGEGADGAGAGDADYAERAAVASALKEAAALRGWIAQYNAFDKLRVRRIGAVNSDFSNTRPLPVVLTKRG
ncbi:hypothetical protein [Corynebacterium macclintockiae]|uniref:hypothetical protein n=1 Tax=Corynebacterium macclintockiae TaxID=2913501 RepID=UPI00254A6B79|nr:hypothetical protein [Corynebacterium macclintockiae]MDK8869959.1 hypothetical protein [Corynebacterium macclintockiae]